MIFRAAGLNVRYGEAAVLHDIGIEVAKGQIITVIGPNGAGKTTLLNAIMGLHGGSGTLHFSGRDVTRMPVEDNLRLGGFRFRHEAAIVTRRQLDEVYALFPRLRERRRQLAGTLSGGERQMLAMGRALMSRPDLLMLDEPSLGLAPLIVREIFAIIADLRARSCSVLLVEQNARAALQVADYGYVLETGRITLQGPSADLAVDPRVIETYLGAVRAVPAPL